MHSSFSAAHSLLDHHGFEINRVVYENDNVSMLEVKMEPYKTLLGCTILKDQESFRTQIEILTAVRHKNIMKLVSYFSDQNFYYIVHELYCENNLEDQKMLPKEEIQMYSLQILSALEALHLNGVFLGGLTPKNLHFDRNGLIKIVDFENSTVDINLTISKSQISNNYPAPEMFIDQPFNGRAADLFSFGIVLYHMVTGTYPWKEFKGMEDYEEKRIKTIEFIKSQPELLYGQTIISLLDKNPSNRPTLENLQKIFGLVQIKMPKLQLSGKRFNSDIYLKHKLKVPILGNKKPVDI